MLRELSDTMATLLPLKSHSDQEMTYVWKIANITHQEGKEGGSRELQTGQLHLHPWEGNGKTNPGNHF